jgi:Asp-tRNA(Asn)/Glu-tRNA(Gln) amidotransferase A subunit family amidase
MDTSWAQASEIAAAIARLEAQGAVLVGALNMGEYAYDFTGENVHYGASRNPHDVSRMPGGSSGGSGAAVAGGLVPLALGSDTNGSIRVPASLCGIFGLKPTYGRLSRAGTFPFVASLDHVGPLARGVRDLALAYDAMQGYDRDDPVCTDRPPEPVSSVLDRGSDDLRIAVAGDYFRVGALPEAQTALERVAAALSVKSEIEIPGARQARSVRLPDHCERRQRASPRALAKAGARFRSRRARSSHRRRSDSSRAPGQGTKIPALVSRADASALHES